MPVQQGGNSGVAPSADANGASTSADQFRMTEDMLAAQLLSNTDTFMSLAKSLAEFSQESLSAGLGPGSGHPSSLHQEGSGLALQDSSGVFGSDVASGSFSGVTFSGDGSPAAPGMDEYDPDDPV